MVFPVVMYGCESWTVKKAERWRISAFELWCCRRLLRIPWTIRRSNQSILKEISTEYSLEGLMLKLKFQSFGHLMQTADSQKSPWCWKRLRAKKRVSEGKMAGHHHQCSERELGQTPREGEGQGGLVCYSPWGCKELDRTGWLNNTRENIILHHIMSFNMYTN